MAFKPKKSLFSLLLLSCFLVGCDDSSSRSPRIDPPTISSVTPSSTLPSGGVVTITGTSLSSVTAVSIGGNNALNFSVNSEESLNVTVPPGSGGAKDIVVSNAAGTAVATGSFTYLDRPTFASITPVFGLPLGGTSVTITGTNFAPGTTVTIGGSPLTNLTLINDSTLMGLTPAGVAGLQDVVVTSSVGTVTGASAFTFLDTPTFATITPRFGLPAGGTSVTISGTSFLPGTTVTVGGTPLTNLMILSDSSITGITASGTLGLRDVVITNPVGSVAAAGAFAYLDPPTFGTITPSVGVPTGGSSVTITGTNFALGTTVTIGGSPLTNLTIINENSITGMTPAGRSGQQDVVVTNPVGTITASGAFTYLNLPTLGTITPPMGVPAGGTSLTITGTNFALGTTVTIGGSPLTNLTIINENSITGMTPAGRSGPQDVVITNPVGSATGVGAFTYLGIVVPEGLATLAGNGTRGFADNADPLQGQFFNLSGVAVDSSGNVYVADPRNNRVRKIDVVTGALVTFAGNGVEGFADNADPLQGQLNQPGGVAVDSAGNVYIVDTFNHRIRKVEVATGALVTIAGNGSPGFADNVDPLQGQLFNPTGMTVDSAGNLYIADTDNNRIRKLEASTGALVTIAGSGTQGFADNADPLQGQLNRPLGVTLDNAGNVYIADTSNRRVRTIEVNSGALVTIAGNGIEGFADNTDPLQGQFTFPIGIAVDSLGNVYVSDSNNQRVRKIDATTGTLVTIAGNGTQGFADNVVPLQGQLNGPSGLAVDNSGNLYIADRNNSRVRTVKAIPPMVIPDGLGTVAGDVFAGFADNADPLQGRFNSPFGVAVDSSGNIYIADKDNHRIRKIEVSTGALVTIAGNGTAGFADNADPLQGQFNFPGGVAVDSVGNVYIADGLNRRIRKIEVATGALVTIAGNGTLGFADNVDALQGQFSNTNALAVDRGGSIYVADTGNERIRKIDAASGALITIAGNGTRGSADNADPLQGQFRSPSGVAIDSAGNVYIVDQSNDRIRKIVAATGALVTIAGNGSPGFADNTDPLQGQFSFPTAIAVDSALNIYITDSGNHRIRKIEASTGALVTIAGSGMAGFVDNVAPLQGQLLNPRGLAVDRFRNVYVAGFVTHRIRSVKAP